MRLTDKKRVVDVEIREWDPSRYGYGPDWAEDFFDAATLPYNDELDAYEVKDVDYCIHMALSEDDEGACYNAPNMHVFVDGEWINRC